MPFSGCPMVSLRTRPALRRSPKMRQTMRPTAGMRGGEETEMSWKCHRNGNSNAKKRELNAIYNNLFSETDVSLVITCHGNGKTGTKW